MFSISIHAESLPIGWFLTTPEQYLAEDIEWYKGIPPNKVVADFNGDKIKDTAWVLTDKVKKKWGLFVSLSNNKEKPTIIKLDENEITSHIFMGISPLKPGEYKTACGKGYWDCSKDEKPLLKLKNTGVNYFKFESANSVYYWSENKLGINQIWLSD